MSSEVELLPCPFCGGPARVHEPDMKSVHWQDVYVECTACEATGEATCMNVFDSEDPPPAVISGVAAAWNRRSASPSIGRVTTDGRDGWNNEELAVRVLAVAYAVEERFGGLRVTFNEGGVGREGGSMSVKEVCDMLAKMLRTGAPL